MDLQPPLFFVQLTVRDCPASLAWYQKVLLLEVRFRESGDQLPLNRRAP